MTQTVNLSVGTQNHQTKECKSMSEDCQHHVPIQSTGLWGNTLRQFLIDMFNHDIVWIPKDEQEEVPF